MVRCGVIAHIQSVGNRVKNKREGVPRNEKARKQKKKNCFVCREGGLWYIINWNQSRVAGDGVVDSLREQLAWTSLIFSKTVGNMRTPEVKIDEGGG